MGSEELDKRKGQTLRLVRTVLFIITVTACSIQGIKIFKGTGTSNNTARICLRESSTAIRSSSQEAGPKALPIAWSQVRALNVITDFDKPVAGRIHKNSGRREFRFAVSVGDDWTGTATTPSHHQKPFSVRIPLHSTMDFQRVMNNVTMIRAAYAHAPGPVNDAHDQDHKVYRPFFTHHENTKYRIRFEFENYSDDLEILSISQEHCDLERLPVQCGHFPWVVLPFGTSLSSEPSCQWIVDNNEVDEALETISLYLRG